MSSTKEEEDPIDNREVVIDMKQTFMLWTRQVVNEPGLTYGAFVTRLRRGKVIGLGLEAREGG